MTSPVVLVLIGIAVVAAIAVLGYYQEKKRRETMRLWARSRGLSFWHGRDDRFENRYPLFDCLREGSKRHARLRMEGEVDGRETCCFDYRYETYSTNSKGQRQTHTHNLSGAVVNSGLPLRALRLRPENALDRIAEFVGFDDIDFESAAFSRAFHVTAPNRKWAFEVLHQATIEFLMEQPRFTIELAGPWVMVRRSGRLGPEDFGRAMALANGILDRLPRYLLRELKGEDV